MSEHGWPDFHDDGSHHEDVHHDDALQHQDDALHHEDLHHEDLPQHDDVHDEDGGYFDHDGDLAPEHDASAADPHEVHDVDGGHDDTPVPEGHDTVVEHDTVVGHDPDALNEPAGAEDVSSFPPILDVGPLPEPVDGFPWIDTGSLGLIDPATLHAAATTPVDPHELAEYAGADLPPGADPWATLSDSDDPATSALAKWWSENS
jgi:hypothetical protein